MPLEVQSHAVSPLKALISGKMEPRGLRCGSTFILCYALLKKPILLHTEGLVKTEMASAVLLILLEIFTSLIPIIIFWNSPEKILGKICQKILE